MSYVAYVWTQVPAFFSQFAGRPMPDESVKSECADCDCISESLFRFDLTWKKRKPPDDVISYVHERN